MIGQAILSWIRGRRQPKEFDSESTILGDIRERVDPGRPFEAPSASTQPPARSPVSVLSDASIEFLSESGPLQVFSIKLKPPIQGGLDYLTLDEALATTEFSIAEVGAGGQVPTVKVTNRSDRMVLLVAGEMLVGCKQDRVLNKSIMVAAQSEVLIPVSCVEAGRWRHRSASFGSAGLSSYSALRKIISKSVSASYKNRGVPASNQDQVWSGVREKMARMGSSSASSALHQVFEDYEGRLSESVGGLTEPRDSHGVVFVMKGRIEGADLFDRPSTLTKLWPKLARSYAIDALEDTGATSKPMPPQGVADWLNSVSHSKTEWFESPGLGKDGRIEGEGVHGGTLVVEDDVVHLEVFSEDEHLGHRSTEGW